jgi:hypothetical protein
MKLGISYKTIAELRAFTLQDVKLNSKVYLTDGGKEGEFVYDSSDTTSSDNTGTIVVAESARFKRVYNKTVNSRWFGATGNGTTDDTTSLSNALSYCVTRNEVLLIDAGEYKVTNNLFNDDSVSGEKNLYIQFKGKVKITVPSGNSQIDVPLIRYSHNTTSNVHLYGDSCEVNLNNKCKGFIAVRNYGISGSAYVLNGGVANISLASLSIINTYADTTTDNFSCPLFIDGTYDKITVENVFINGVSRSGSATGDSKGIHIGNTRGVAHVKNSVVKNVLAHASYTVNADGISIFGLKLNPSVENSFRTGIAKVENCYFLDNQGRHIKIQTSNATIENNTFERNLVVTIPNSRDVDCQHGAGRVINNTIKFKKNGATSPLDDYHASIRWCAILEDEEMYCSAENNTFYTDVEIPYPFFVEHRDAYSTSVKASVIDVINNHIINTDSFTTTGCIGKGFVEFDALHVGQLETKTTINIRDNSYFSTAQPLLSYNSSTGISLGDKLVFTLENNRNTNLSVLPKLFSYSSGGTEVIKVNRYKILNNSGFNDRVSSAWYVDFSNEKIMPHSEFVVDLSTNTIGNGKLINAPSDIPTSDYAFVKVLNDWEGATYIEIYVHTTTRRYFYSWNGFSWVGDSVGVGSNLGQHPLTLTTTGTSTLGLPNTGTLATLAGTESLTNKTVNGVVLSSGAGATNFLNGDGNYVLVPGSTGVNGEEISVKTANYTLLTSDDNIVFSTAGVTATLPSPSNKKLFRIKNVSNGDVSVSGHLDSNSGSIYTLPSLESVTLISNGSTWYIF